MFILSPKNARHVRHFVGVKLVDEKFFGHKDWNIGTVHHERKLANLLAK